MAIKYLAGNRIQGLSTDRQTSATATINFTKHFAMSDCSSYSSTESSTFPSNGGSFGSDQVNCYFSFATFDTTSIPDGSTITEIRLQGQTFKYVDDDVSTAQVKQITTNFTAGSATAWSQVRDNISYTTINISDETTHPHTVVLGSTANANLQSQLSANWFHLGFDTDADSTNQGITYWKNDNSPTTACKIVVSYLQNATFNVEDGTIFEETDTGKHFIRSGSTWGEIN